MKGKTHHRKPPGLKNKQTQAVETVYN